MVDFGAVRCPVCNTVVLEIASGMARVKCPQCKRRVWALSDGKEIRIGLVDRPRKKVLSP